MKRVLTTLCLIDSEARASPETPRVAAHAAIKCAGAGATPAEPGLGARVRREPIRRGRGPALALGTWALGVAMIGVVFMDMGMGII